MKAMRIKGIKTGFPWRLMNGFDAGWNQDIYLPPAGQYDAVGQSDGIDEL